MRGQRRVAFLLVGGGDAEGGQHRHQRALRDVDPATTPVVVAGGDPESTREFDQRRRHVAHTAILLGEKA